MAFNTEPFPSRQGEPDEHQMSTGTATASLVAASCSCIATAGVLWLTRVASRRSGWRGVLIPDSTNFRLYIVIIAVDWLWSLKFIADSILTFAGVSHGSRWCYGFGFFEILFTMAREAAGILFWAHVCAIVFGCLRESNTHPRLERIFVAISIAISYGFAMAVAGVALGLDWIERKSPGAWCWFDDGNFALQMVFGYGIDFVQAVLAIVGLVAGTLCRKEANVWPRPVVASLRRRAWMAFFPCALGLLSALVKEATHHVQWQTTLMLAFQATLIPLEGFVDAMVFLWSEPRVPQAMFGMDEEDRTEMEGFTASLETIRRTPAPSSANGSASPLMQVHAGPNYSGYY